MKILARASFTAFRGSFSKREMATPIYVVETYSKRMHLQITFSPNFAAYLSFLLYAVDSQIEIA